MQKEHDKGGFFVTVAFVTLLQHLIFSLNIAGEKGMTLTSIFGYIIHQEPLIAKSILTDKKTLCLLKALRASSSAEFPYQMPKLHNTGNCG